MLGRTSGPVWPAVKSLELITIALLLAFSFSSLNANLLVILLERSKTLPSLGELSLLHPFSDVPVDEGTLGVNEIELVVNAGEHLSNGGRIADHADSPHHLRQVSARDDSGWLVIDAALEAGWRP